MDCLFHHYTALLLTYSVTVQAEAYVKQEAVRSNMCATFLSLSDTQELQQYAPDPEYVLVHVAPRQQDSTFAGNLAMLIRTQAESLAASLPGTRSHAIGASNGMFCSLTVMLFWHTACLPGNSSYSSGACFFCVCDTQQ